MRSSQRRAVNQICSTRSHGGTLPSKSAEASQAAAAGHGHLEFLAALMAAEVGQRESDVERARIKAARFPEQRELADFDFSLVPSQRPRSGRPGSRRVDRAPGGGAGRGPARHRETRICTALGLEACRQCRRVHVVIVADLVIELAEAQAEHWLSRLEQQLDHLDLLTLDELGLVRLGADWAQLLFILLGRRYTRGALAL